MPELSKARQTSILADTIVSVKDFGAVGDGVTDDTAAIQAAIDANSGKTIYFPPATYKITSTITINTSSTRLMTDGQAILYAPVGNFDVLYFTCPTNGQYEYLSACALDGRFFIYTDASSVATTGAGVRLTRCSGFLMQGAYILNMAEGLVIEGGKDGQYVDININRASTSSDMTGITDSAVLKITDSATAGSTYQPAWTLKFTNIELGAGFRSQCAVLVTNCDGLQFSTAYINGASAALFRFKNYTVGSYITAVTINNVYLDAVSSTTGSNYCVDIPDDGLASSVYYVAFTGCFLGNCVLDAVRVTKTVTGLQFVGCTIANAARSGIDFTGTAVYLGDLQVVGCKLQNINTGGSGYTVRVGNAISLNLTGNTILHIGSSAAIRLDGSIADATISANNIRATTLDFQNVGTVVRLTYGANQTALASTKALTGLRPGNYANADTNALDWYEEGTFTPALTFGGNAVGIVYTAQTGSYTRIGNRVFFNFNIGLSSKGSSTGAMSVVTNISYLASANTSLSIRFNNGAVGVTANDLFTFIISGTSLVRIDKIIGGDSFVTQLTDVDVLNNLNLLISGGYSVT
jgi:hypothetical protein